jgi:NDP-sugar pyrophosphorylase family protein
MNAYIMCGGKATRVAELTERYGCEKHELPVGEHKFVEYTVRSLLDSKAVRNVEYIMDKDTGTGGAMQCIHTDVFPYIMIYGDMYVEADIWDMYLVMLESRADLMIVTMETSDQDYGMITTSTNKVVGYHRTHEYAENYLTNVGMYLVGENFHRLVESYPKVGEPWSLESEIFERHGDVHRGQAGPEYFSILNVSSYRVDSRDVYDVGTPERYKDTVQRLRW